MENIYRENESLVDDTLVGKIVHVVLHQIFLDAHYCVAYISDYVEVHEAVVTKVLYVFRFEVIIEFQEVFVHKVPFVMHENCERAVCFENFSMNSCKTKRDSFTKLIKIWSTLFLTKAYDLSESTQSL